MRMVSPPPWEKDGEVCSVLMLQRILDVMWSGFLARAEILSSTPHRWRTHFSLDIPLVMGNLHPSEFVVG